MWAGLVGFMIGVVGYLYGFSFTSTVIAASLIGAVLGILKGLEK